MRLAQRKLFVLVVGLALLGTGIVAGGAEPAGASQAAPADTPAKDKTPPRTRSCILLWMSGGPSHIDTFDMKPEAPMEIRGEFKPVETNVAGIKICEHLPKIAKLTDHLVIIRSLKHFEADHGRAAYLMQTGRNPGFGDPALGAVLAKELGNNKSTFPPFIYIGEPPQAGAGELGERYAPHTWGPEQSRKLKWTLLDHAKIRVDAEQSKKIGALIRQLGDRDFKTRDAAAADLEKLGLTTLPAIAEAKAAKPDLETMTRLEQISDRILDKQELPVREGYGKNSFAEACLTARRLVEAGVPFVQVTMGGWDTHAKGFATVKNQCAVLDSAWAALITDLKERGLLDTTLIVWAGEFGRTPRINQQQGRDHWSQAFSAVLAGGGIKGGQVIGSSDRQGAFVAERPVTVPELWATIFKAMGVDHAKSMPAGTEPIKEVFPATSDKPKP